MSLDDAIALAAQHSFDLASSEEALYKAELNVDRAWALIKPTLGASFGFTHVAPAPSGSFAIPEIFDLSKVAPACFDANAPGLGSAECTTAFRNELDRVRNSPGKVFQFAGADTAVFRAQVAWNILNGRAIPLLQNAKASVEVENLKRRSRERLLRLEVARAFYAVEAAEQAVPIATRALERTKARLALAEQKQAVGEQPAAAYRLERLADEQARVDLERAKMGIRQALFALSFVIGVDEPIEGTRSPPEPVLPTISSTTALVAKAQAQRDDVLIAAAAVQIAERAITDVWWKFAPTLGLFGAFRWSNVAGISGQNEEWSLGFNANWVLYDGGLRYADLHEAESNLRLARSTLERTKTLVAQDVERASLGLMTKRVALDRARVVAAVAKERADLTRTQVEAGSARDLELSEALDAERDAALAEIASKLERDLAVLELKYASGED
ncbi:MAG: TolC family protein [Myxococcota bacterium]